MTYFKWIGLRPQYRNGDFVAFLVVPGEKNAIGWRFMPTHSLLGRVGGFYVIGAEERPLSYDPWDFIPSESRRRMVVELFSSRMRKILK